MTPLLAAFDYPQFDPVLLQLGPIAIRWYGLAYMAAFAVGYASLLRLARRGELRVRREQVGSLVTWPVLGVMLGGRLGWWLFYHRPTPGEAEPWYEPIAMWHGGMSFHGGLLGVTAALLAWTRLHKAPLWNVADALALVTPIGLFFGRVANFINAELVGRPTTLPWGVVYPGEPFARHPSQLYEALLEGALLFALLWTLRRRRGLCDGRIAAAFLAGYGLMRFGAEFARAPDDQLGFVALGWLTMGQLLSGLMVAAGALLWACRSCRSILPPSDERKRPSVEEGASSARDSAVAHPTTWQSDAVPQRIVN